jgi:hypothetical protein
MKMESSFLYAKNKSPCFGLVNEGHEVGIRFLYMTYLGRSSQ